MDSGVAGTKLNRLDYGNAVEIEGLYSECSLGMTGKYAQTYSSGSLLRYWV